MKTISDTIFDTEDLLIVFLCVKFNNVSMMIIEFLIMYRSFIP